MKTFENNDALLFEKEAWAKYKEESDFEITFEEFKKRTTEYCAMIQKELQNLINSFGVVCPNLVKVITQSKQDWAELEIRFMLGKDPDAKTTTNNVANLC